MQSEQDSGIGADRRIRQERNLDLEPHPTPDALATTIIPPSVRRAITPEPPGTTNLQCGALRRAAGPAPSTRSEAISPASQRSSKAAVLGAGTSTSAGKGGASRTCVRGA